MFSHGTSNIGDAFGPEDSASQAGWRDAVERYRMKEQEAIGMEEPTQPQASVSTSQLSRPPPVPVRHVDSGMRFPQEATPSEVALKKFLQNTSLNDDGCRKKPRLYSIH